MNVRHLESFVHIVKHHGFNRASAHLHIAQSALSRQIHQLERELGVELFVRSGRGVQMTHAGELLAKRAESLLRQFRQTREELMAESRSPRGELAIGIPPSLEQTLAVPLLRQFRKLYPLVFVSTWDGTSNQLREWVLSGKLDLALLGIIEPESVLDETVLSRDSVYVVGSKSAGLQGSSPVELQSLVDLPLLATSRPNGMRLLIDHAAARKHLRMNVVMEVNSVALLIDLLIDGAGFSVLPQSAVEPYLRSGQLCGARINDLSLTWICASSRERPLSAAARHMRTLLKTLAAGLVRRELIAPELSMKAGGRIAAGSQAKAM
jgi:LysR family nitrogen assimilation transcriptional regulator